MKSKDVGLKYGFRSGLEERVNDQLQHEKIRYTYEDTKYAFTQPEKRRTYTPDFILTGTGGKEIIIETKGRFLLADRQKHLMVRACHPDLDIRFVFTNPKVKISKGAKSSYADWCDKHDYKYAKGLIPSEWLEELEGE